MTNWEYEPWRPPTTAQCWHHLHGYHWHYHHYHHDYGKHQAPRTKDQGPRTKDQGPNTFVFTMWRKVKQIFYFYLFLLKDNFGILKVYGGGWRRDGGAGRNTLWWKDWIIIMGQIQSENLFMSLCLLHLTNLGCFFHHTLLWNNKINLGHHIFIGCVKDKIVCHTLSHHHSLIVVTPLFMCCSW